MLALACAVLLAPSTIVAKIYHNVPADLADINQRLNHGRLAPLEPIYGCYIGAFIANEDEIKTLIPTDFGNVKDVSDFQRIVGKRHSIYFNYSDLTEKGFPDQEATLFKRRAAAFHIALEPSKFDMVDDSEDGPVRKFARLAAESEIPLFVRFASECNDPKNPWGGHPDIYKKRFRLFAHVMREEFDKYKAKKQAEKGVTPPRNYAMVWCVTNDVNHNFDPYYPGEDVVDWVGVNFYSVIYHNNDPKTPGWQENPADCLKQIYTTYASRHPICVGEWAATRGQTGRTPNPDFAVSKIGQLYSSLPRLYPRLKAVNYFSMNAIKWAPQNPTNDYSLLETQGVSDQYGRMISAPYFLKKVYKTGQDAFANSPYEVVPAPARLQVHGNEVFSAYVRAKVDRPKVTWRLNGRPISRSADVPGSYDLTLDTTTIANGTATLTLEVVAGAQRATQKIDLIVKN